MEFYAKFRITDPGIFWSLQTINKLGVYSLSNAKIQAIEDAYLDTKKRRLLNAGYSCRRRNQKKGFLITLEKHNKESAQKPKQWDVNLMKFVNTPRDWPKSQARKRSLQVIPDKKLQVIFNLNQTRITRFIKMDKQDIGQFNLNDVSMIIKGKEKNFKTLELIIFLPDNKKHISLLTKALQAKWALEDEPLSKFERAIRIENKLAQ